MFDDFKLFIIALSGGAVVKYQDKASSIYLTSGLFSGPST